jgi:hypothetical protein
MSRSFLTGLNLNKNELLNARIQNLQNAPSSPVAGQIYYDTDTNQITLWNGTAWVSLATGGDVSTLITNAINALTTSDIEEGTNLYFTDERAQDAVANAIAAGTHSNITITYDDSTNKFTFAAENGVADSTTTDLAEGTNLYFTDERAQDAVGNNVGTGLSYNDSTGAISVNTSTIATTSYVDGLVQGLNVKGSVRVASTATVNLSSATAVDGVTLADGDRVLLKNQSSASENGIYVFNAAWPATNNFQRAVDANPIDKGDYVLVTNGTYAATGWIATTSGMTGTWTQFSAANEYTAGTNIAIAGNAISFDGILPVANGGTNANTAAGAKTSLGFTTKYAENNTLLEPTSNVVTWVVTHGMASRDVNVQVYELSTYEQVEVDVARTNTAAVTLTWVATTNVAADAYRVVVVG